MNLDFSPHNQNFILTIVNNKNTLHSSAVLNCQLTF